MPKTYFTDPVVAEIQDAGGFVHWTAAYEDSSTTKGLAEAQAAAEAAAAADLTLNDRTSMALGLSPRLFNMPANPVPLLIGAQGVPLFVTPGAMLRPPSGSTYVIAGVLANDPGRQWIDESDGGMVLWGWGAATHVYPDWFGPSLDSGLDDTAMIQAAIDNLGGYDNARRVTLHGMTVGQRPRLQMRSREYWISQLVIPNNTWIEGAGMGANGQIVGTRFNQISGSALDMFRFDARVGGGSAFLSHVYLRNFQIFGNGEVPSSGSPLTHGIHFTQENGDPFSIADTCIFENIYIRRIYGDGIRVGNGPVPGKFQNIRPFECFGAGLRFLRSNTVTSQSILLDSISGDACRDGLIVFEGYAANERFQPTVTILNCKSEHRVTAHTGWAPDAADGWQEDAVVFHNCEGLAVNVVGLNHHNGGTTATNSRAAIRITGSGAPAIRFDGVTCTYKSAKSGEPMVILDESASPVVVVPRTTRFGSYGMPSTHRAISASSDSTDVRGLRTLFAYTSGGDVEIGGFSGGVPGQRLDVVKATGVNTLIIRHNKGGVEVPINTAGQRDHVVGSFGGVQLVCSASAEAWIVIDAAEPRNVSTITDPGVTTPSVAGMRMLRLGYTSAATLTQLLKGAATQRVTLVATNANATVQHGTATDNLRLAGSINWTLPVNGVLVVEYDVNSSIWREVSRTIP